MTDDKKKPEDAPASLAGPGAPASLPPASGDGPTKEEKQESSQSQMSGAPAPLAASANLDKTNLTSRPSETIRLQVSSLAEARARLPPQLPEVPGLTPLPDAPIVIVDTVDVRAALPLVAASLRTDKRFISFGIADTGETTLGRTGDRRSILRLLRDTFDALPEGVLIVADPDHRGRGAEFWTRLAADAPVISEWLKGMKAQLAVIRVGSGAAQAPAEVARIEAPGVALLEALCEAKGIHTIDPRVLTAPAERLRRFIEVLAYDDDGDAYFEELEALTDTEAARKEADAQVGKFLVTGSPAGPAALFTAAHLPQISFFDFQAIVSDILASDAFAPKKDEPAPILDDATLAAVGLKRARVNRPQQAPITALRFKAGARFSEIIRRRIETQAPVFSGHAFAALRVRATIGALQGEAAEFLAERAAAHIVANGGGDLDKLASAAASWLASAGAGTKPRDLPFLKQRLQSLREQLPRLIVASARGLASTGAASVADATGAIALHVVKTIPDSPLAGPEAARLQARCAYVGLLSGAPEARIAALIKTLEAAAPAARWLVQAFVGNNLGLLGEELPHAGLEGVDRLISACLSEQLAERSEHAIRRRFLEAMSIRALCLRIREDSERVMAEMAPAVSSGLLAQLVQMSVRKDGVGGGFLYAEQAAARLLDGLEGEELDALLGTSPGARLLKEMASDHRSRFAAAEAAFLVNTMLASALAGSDVSDNIKAVGQAFDAFALEIQRRSSSEPPVNISYAAAGVWQEDFAQNPVPFAKALSAFSRQTAELRAIAPAIAAALATAQRTLQTIESGTFAAVRCSPGLYAGLPRLERTERQALLEGGQRASELAQKTQDAWRDGLEAVGDWKEKTKLMREARARVGLVRSFASAVRNAGAPPA